MTGNFRCALLPWPKDTIHECGWERQWVAPPCDAIPEGSAVRSRVSAMDSSGSRTESLAQTQSSARRQALVESWTRVPTSDHRPPCRAREQQQHRLPQRRAPRRPARGPHARGPARAAGGPAPRAPARAGPGPKWRPLGAKRWGWGRFGAGLGPVWGRFGARPQVTRIPVHGVYRCGPHLVAGRRARNNGEEHATRRHKNPDFRGAPPRAPHSTHCAVHHMDTSICPGWGSIRVYGRIYGPQSAHGAAQVMCQRVQVGPVDDPY